MLPAGPISRGTVGVCFVYAVPCLPHMCRIGNSVYPDRAPLAAKEGFMSCFLFTENMGTQSIYRWLLTKKKSGTYAPVRDISPGDPTCMQFGFQGDRGRPTPMMEKSVVFKLHGHMKIPGVRISIDAQIFEQDLCKLWELSTLSI